MKAIVSPGQSLTRLKSMLNDMYASHYCFSDGKCKHFLDCQSETDKPCIFCSDKVQIGDLYDSDPSIPKIMVVGLEGKHNNDNPVISGIFPPSKTGTKAHYRGVRYVLSYILAPFFGIPSPKTTAIDHLYDSQEIAITERYILSNIYKCAFAETNQCSNLPHTPSMKQYCQYILFDEIDIIEPDIIIIQCVNNHPANFWPNLLTLYSDGKANMIQGDGENNNTAVYKMHHKSGKPFLSVWSYHGNWRRFSSRKYLDILDSVLDAAIQEYRRIKIIDLQQ